MFAKSVSWLWESFSEAWNVQKTLNSSVSFSFVWQCYGFSSLIVVFLNHCNENFSQSSIKCNTLHLGVFGECLYSSNTCTQDHVHRIRPAMGFLENEVWAKGALHQVWFCSHTRCGTFLEVTHIFMRFLALLLQTPET